MLVIKLLPVLFLLAILLTPLYPVYAVDSTTSAKPPTLKERMEQQRIKQSANLDSRLEKVASREARLKAKQDALKTKLRTFKDQLKATKVEQINTNLNLVNERRTINMTHVLEMLTKLVDKIEDRLGQSTASDVSKQQVTEKLSETRLAITDAENAVASQSAKEYSVQVSSESAAKADAKVARDALHNDLQATHLMVKGARDAVVELLSSYRQMLKGGGTENGN